MVSIFSHAILFDQLFLSFALMFASIIILLYLEIKKHEHGIRLLSIVTTLISWFFLFPSGAIYTSTLIEKKLCLQMVFGLGFILF